MAYVFLPDESIAGSPISDGEGGQVIEFVLGFDTEDDMVVVMAVMLSATARPDVLELHFGIRERIGDGPASGPDYSKEAADEYVPKNGRSHVLDLIRQCVSKIVPAALPQYILMETFYADLPLKALEKYKPICGSVIICGYLVEDEWRDVGGINYWVFARRSGPSATEYVEPNGNAR